MPNIQDTDTLSPDERAAQQALALVQPRLDALREAEIDRRLAIDASAASVIALATATKVEPFRGVDRRPRSSAWRAEVYPDRIHAAPTSAADVGERAGEGHPTVGRTADAARAYRLRPACGQPPALHLAGAPVARVRRDGDLSGVPLGDHEVLGARHRVEAVADARRRTADDEHEADQRRDERHAAKPIKSKHRFSRGCVDAW